MLVVVFGLKYFGEPFLPDRDQEPWKNNTHLKAGFNSVEERSGAGIIRIVSPDCCASRAPLALRRSVSEPLKMLLFE